ncbi:MAG: branched-chain amino acid ABC transporter permease [Dehalococcoidia bacterium]
MKKLLSVLNVQGATSVSVPIVLLCVLTLASSFASPLVRRDVTTMLVYVVFVVGLYVFVGNSGILSFGHASFMLIGAYVTALVTIPVTTKSVLLPHLPSFVADLQLSVVPAAAMAGIVAALFAGLAGAPLMRLAGIAATIATFALLLVANTVANNWDAVTRGRGTMIGVPTETTRYRALLFACLAIVVAYAFQRSRVGLELRASREDSVTASSVGINVVRARWIAFVVSGFVTGVAGFLYAQLLGAYSPDTFFLTTTFLAIAMLVIGGIYSLGGAVIGTVAVSALTAGLRHIERGIDLYVFDLPARPGTEKLGVALAMMVILIFRPNGLVGDHEIEFRLLARWRGGRATVQPMQASDLSNAPARDSQAGM